MVQEKKKITVGKHTTVEETESTYKAVCEGETMLYVEYDELIDKWHITSVPFQLDETWDYRKGQKDEVVLKAMLLTKEHCERKLWERTVDRLVDIGHIAALVFTLFDLIYELTYGHIVGCVIFLILAFLSLLRLCLRRKAICIVPFVLWIFCAVLKIHTILSLFALNIWSQVYFSNKTYMSSR